MIQYGGLIPCVILLAIIATVSAVISWGPGAGYVVGFIVGLLAGLLNAYVRSERERRGIKRNGRGIKGLGKML